jgi:Zn-dependent metalloprotease
MQASDNLDQRRTFEVLRSGESIYLVDQLLSVSSHTLNFERRRVRTGELPGDTISNPPPLSPEAVGVHANTSEVARFIEKVLKHQWSQADNSNQTRYISNIHLSPVDDSSRDCKEAAWLNSCKQAFFGQFYIEGKIVCYADEIDVVAHEFFHYITCDTSDLKSGPQARALRESYSDIFGIIIKNQNISNINEWDWKIGNRLGEGGAAQRDIAMPSSNVATSMQQFDPSHGDHYNSGVHTRAAYYLINSLFRLNSERSIFGSSSSMLKWIFSYAINILESLPEISVWDSSNLESFCLAYQILNSRIFIYRIESIAVLFHKALTLLNENAVFRNSLEQLCIHARTVFLERYQDEVIEEIRNAFAMVEIT